jgi:triacylglycerol lipase
MAKICRKVQKWATESIERPIEEYVDRTKEECKQKKCKWWMLCLNKVFCWIKTYSVLIITFIFVTVPKLVWKIVCEAVVSVTTGWISPLGCFFGFSVSSNINLFSLRKALFFAKVSQEAYSEPSSANFSSISNDLKVIRFIENTPNIAGVPLIDTQVYVLYDIKNNRLILSFRGTEKKFVDWLNDFTFTQTPLFDSDKFELNGLVHTGFYLAYLIVRKQLITLVLNEVKNNNVKKVCITGHSLGGGIATIAALDISRLMKNDIEVEVYTYGAPRVGNPEFSDYYNEIVKNSFRIVNENDLATFVPPPKVELNLHYRHVNTLVFLDLNGNLSMDPCPKPIYKSIDELSKIFPIVGTPLTFMNGIVQLSRQYSGFGDSHKMELYLSNLETLRREQLRNLR